MNMGQGYCCVYHNVSQFLALSQHKPHLRNSNCLHLLTHLFIHLGIWALGIWPGSCSPASPAMFILVINYVLLPRNPAGSL